MRRHIVTLMLLLALAPTAALARGHSTPPSTALVLGRLSTGATVTFTRMAPAGWGIAVDGGAAARVVQPRPARLEVFRSEDEIRELTSGYDTVQKLATGVEARADVAEGGVVYQVIDHWGIGERDSVLSVRRSVTIRGQAAGGFSSSLVFAIDPAVGWSDLQFLAPGALYGDPTYDGDRSVGGTLNHAARRFVMREDVLPAPLFALSFAKRCLDRAARPLAAR